MHRDWFDWASLIFNTLATSAGLVGLFIAVRAYKISKQQNLVTYEVATLREIYDILKNQDFRVAFKRAGRSGLEKLDVSQEFNEFGITHRLDTIADRSRVKGWVYFSHPIIPGLKRRVIPFWLTGDLLSETGPHLMDFVLYMLESELQNAIKARLTQ